MTTKQVKIDKLSEIEKKIKIKQARTIYVQLLNMGYSKDSAEMRDIMDSINLLGAK